MLRPYVCVVCERAIIAKDDVPSLINLFNKIVIRLAPGVSPETIEKNAIGPKEWVVFSSWETEPGDEMREFFLCTQVSYPDESPFGEIVKLKLNIERGKRSQATVQLNAFPIGQVGFYTVKTWVEEQQRIVYDPIQIKIEVRLDRAE